ncbi:MAG: dTDP-4-dehydrorhamnose reductase [Rickettsiaceae bacterium]|nr:dTDP-4-dehydrorhamnose reductase [Rickettsiaceae bacterium]
MQIIIIGQNGQLGTKLALEANQKNYNYLQLSRNEIDLSDKGSIFDALSKMERFLKLSDKKVIINASAFTNVEMAEIDTENAYKVNAYSNQLICDYAKKHNILYVSYSTDYVFDGTSNKPYKESDQANPINQYGFSKLKGEEIIQKSGSNYLILRTSWVFSEIGTNFVKKIFDLLASGNDLNVIQDQVGTPTSAKFIAETTFKLIEYFRGENIKHIINIAQHPEVSWFDLAMQIKYQLNSNVVIHPILSQNYKMKAKRPGYSALSTEKLEKIIGSIRSWDVDLHEVINNLK